MTSDDPNRKPLSDQNRRRGVTAQLEALTLVEACHRGDWDLVEDLIVTAESTPNDLIRGLIGIADIELSTGAPGDFEHRIGALRATLARIGGM